MGHLGIGLYPWRLREAMFLIDGRNFAICYLFWNLCFFVHLKFLFDYFESH